MDATRKELRKFGWLVGGIFLLLGAWLLWRRSWGSPTGAVFVILAVGLLWFATLMPHALGPFHRAWMFLGHVLGWINTRLILGAIFYVGFTLTRLILLVLRKDPLYRRPARGLNSYWVDVSDKKYTAESLEHPF